jgi:2-methylisocitrate lyase-like PEP mutase family enzyme
MLYEDNEKNVKKGFIELMEEGPVMAPCVYDCVSARLVEDAGFKAMCLSGGELAASLCGVPDIGLVTLDELVGVVERISACTSIPMIVDIDTGFGNEINLIRTCKRVAQAGAKAVHLEDQTFPKRCGHLRGKEVISHDAYISKIKAAAWALKGTGCALIARTDSYHVLGKEEAISRCNDAIDAGADVSFVEGCGSLDDIRDMAKEIKGYKMFAMASAGASPKVTFKQLSEWGYSLMTMHYAMAGALMGIEEYGRKCYEAMSDIPVTEDPRVDSSPIYLFELFGLHEWLQLGKRFNSEIKDAEEFDKKDE